MERSYISNLATFLNTLEKKKKYHPKKNRQQEIIKGIIKLRAEINEIGRERGTQVKKEKERAFVFGFLFVCSFVRISIRPITLTLPKLHKRDREKIHFNEIWNGNGKYNRHQGNPGNLKDMF